MKKLCLLVILATFLFTCADALADGGETYGVENTPEEIKVIVNNSRWSGWEITGWVNPKGLRCNSACAFAVVKNGRENNLLAFGWEDDGWKYKWHNAAALPQVEAPVFLGVLAPNNTARFTSFYVFNEEIMENFCVWVQERDSTWHLNELLHYYPLMFFDTSEEGVLRLYNTGWVEGEETDVKVYGTYETDLRRFDLDAFPKTVEEARERLCNPPKLPAGTLSAKKIQFTSGKKYKVYHGPGEDYGQSGNGKAVVSTNDWIEVFGEENGWILIQYAIDKDHSRFGYIRKETLPKDANVSVLAWLNKPAYLLKETSMTDDPFKSRRALSILQEGLHVTLLGVIDDWAYIEFSNGDWLRGFVESDALTYDQVFKLENQSNGLANGTLVLTADRQMTVSMTITIENLPERFILEDQEGRLIGEAMPTQNRQGGYSAHASLSEDITCICFIPVYRDGTRGEELFNVAW